MSRTLQPLCSLLLMMAAHPLDAQQTFHESFEDDFGQPDMEGWQWSCDDPVLMNTGAPGEGAWCVQKECPNSSSGTAIMCDFVTALYFPLLLDTTAQYTISGWAYVDVPGQDAAAQIGFGSGTLPDSWAGQTDPGGTTNAGDWTFLSFTVPGAWLTGPDVFALLMANDEVGSTTTAHAYFDGIHVVVEPLTATVPHREPTAPRVFPVPCSTTLNITLGPGERVAYITDLSGRIVIDAGAQPLLGTTLNVAGLPSGPYLLHFRSPKGPRIARFVKE